MSEAGVEVKFGVRVSWMGSHADKRFYVTIGDCDVAGCMRCGDVGSAVCTQCQAGYYLHPDGIE